MKLKRNIIIFTLITSTLVGCSSNGILSNNKNSNDSNYSYTSDSNDSYIDVSDYISSNSNIDSSSDEINEYVTVMYDANGGIFTDSTSIKEDRVKKGSKLITPEIPTRVGYTFVSWYYDDIPVESGKWIVPCDCTITAEWKYEKYNITYELNGGIVNNNPSTYNYEDETITLNNPTRVGYTFIGWTGEGYDTPTLEVTIPSHSINNRTYVANWKANEYKVTFDVNGGNELETSEYTYIYDNEYTLPTPIRDGYTFTGWYYNDTLVSSGKWNVAIDCTLTAHYSANPYELTLNNSNNNAGTITGAETYNYGSIVTIKATPNDGYTFIGWYDLNNNCISTDSEYTFAMGLSNVLTAKWEVNTYKITYNWNKEELYYTYQDVKYNSDFKLITPTRDGYTFICWKDENDVTFNETIYLLTKDITLKAIWEVNTYNISYELNGGSVNNNPSTYNYEDETITLNNPTRVGYTFIGWTGEGYDTPTLEVTIPSHSINNRTYVANWKANEYKVTFDVNGGNELETSEYTYTYDNEYTLPIPKKEGHTFTGWYYNDTLVSSGKWDVASDCTLVASYSLNSYDVILNNSNNNAGTITGAETYNYGSIVTIKATPNDGYTFAGWYDLNDNCVSTDSEYTFTLNNDCTLTAKWGYADITINYIVDGKTVYTSIYTLDNHVTELYQYETDKNFYGWYKTNTFNSYDNKVTSTEQLKVENNNVYLYGTVLDANYSFKYENNGYTITKYNDTKEEIEIPSVINSIDVKAIDSETFKDCSFLKSVIILSSINSIGESAFYNCSSLTIYCETSSKPSGWNNNWYSGRPVYYGVTKEDIIEIDGIQYLIIEGKAVITRYVGNDDNVVIPSTIEVNGTTYDVTEIKQYAFSYSSIKAITIPSSVTTIGKGAFYGCIRLISVEFEGNSQLISIEDYLFYECSSLTNIIITGDISSIGSNVFYNCTKLADVYYSGTIEDWCNITFSNGYSNPMYYASHFYMLDENNNYKEIPSIEIPSNITSIGNYQFYGFNNVTSITISSSVTTIGKAAFEYCSSLKNVYYEGIIEDWCIISFIDSSSNPMSNASHFYMLDENNNYKEITSIEISSNITSIGNYQFYGFNNVTSITIPSSVIKIGKSSFQNCNSLKKIILPFIGGNKNGNKYLGYIFGASSYSSNSSYVPSTLKEVIILDGCISIANSAFYNCSKLTNITIPSSVISVGCNALKGCTSLKKLTIPFIGGSKESNQYLGYIFGAISYEQNLTYIPSSLKEIVILEGCTLIGVNSFSDCCYLTSITLPNSILLIEKSAFIDCTSLETITLPFIGESKDSNKYLGYIFGASNDYNSYKYIPSSLKEIIILKGCTSINCGALKGCNSLEKITLPFIGYDKDNDRCLGYLFGTTVYNYNSKYVPSSLKEVIILEGCTSIGDHTFYNCGNLINIIIPSSVTKIGGSAFSGCCSLTNIVIPNGVTIIEEYTFDDCSSLTSITIPSSIISTEKYAFWTCTSLTNVYYEGTIENWCNIEFYNGYYPTPMYYASHFYMLDESNNYKEVTNIVIPNTVTSIGRYQFYGFNNVISITIPSSVTTIGYYAFYGCSSLKTITLPFIGGSKDSNKYLGYIFGAVVSDRNSTYVPSSLKEVIILEGCTSIGAYAFSSCSSLTSITIPSSVTTIGAYAFSSCSSLTSITIPSSVTKIGAYAFSRCSSLTIYCEVSNKQSGWDYDWNYSNCPVVWDYKK